MPCASSPDHAGAETGDISRQGSRLRCGHKRASFASLQDSKSPPPPRAIPSQPHHHTPRPTNTKESFLKDWFLAGRGHGSQNRDTKKPSHQLMSHRQVSSWKAGYSVTLVFPTMSPLWRTVAWGCLEHWQKGQCQVRLLANRLKAEFISESVCKFPLASSVCGW